MMPTAEIVHDIVALDIGGSAIKSGLVSRETVRAGVPLQSAWLRHVERQAIDSGADADRIADAIAAVCNRQMTLAGAAGAVAIAFPGPCDYERGIPYIRGLNKFGALYGIDLAAMLTARLAAPLPIHFVHDAGAAAVGEAVARGLAGGALMMTLGTGFGTAFLDGQRLRCGPFRWSETGGLFAEGAFGQRADDIFSVRGLDRRLAAHGSNCAELRLRIERGTMDTRIGRELAGFGHDLGQWLVPYVVEAAVSLVIVGGGLAALYPWFGPALADALPVSVEPGKLGDGAALIGAACLCEATRSLGTGR
jgi:glucokinase